MLQPIESTNTLTTNSLSVYAFEFKPITRFLVVKYFTSRSSVLKKISNKSNIVYLWNQNTCYIKLKKKKICSSSPALPSFSSLIGKCQPLTLVVTSYSLPNQALRAMLETLDTKHPRGIGLRTGKEFLQTTRSQSNQYRQLSTFLRLRKKKKNP